jgi:hypothetical protein
MTWFLSVDTLNELKTNFFFKLIAFLAINLKGKFQSVLLFNILRTNTYVLFYSF